MFTIYTNNLILSVLSLGVGADSLPTVIYGLGVRATEGDELRIIV